MIVQLTLPTHDEMTFEPVPYDQTPPLPYRPRAAGEFMVMGTWRGFRSPGYGATREQAEADATRSIQRSFHKFFEWNYEDKISPAQPGVPGSMVNWMNRD